MTNTSHQERYTGSPEEARDQAQGLVSGGMCQWLAEGDPTAMILSVHEDADGDAVFHLTFPDTDHKDVDAWRNEIVPLSF